MIFAQEEAAPDVAGEMLHRYGLPGLCLIAVWLLFFFLFKVWIDASERAVERRLKLSEREHERTLKSLENEHIKRLELLNKRDEIRFSTLHAEQVKRIELIYSHLIDLRTASYKADSKDFLSQFAESWEYMGKSRIYLPKELADHIEGFHRAFEKLLEIKQTEETMEDFLKVAPQQALALINQRRDILDTKLPPLFLELESAARSIIQGYD